MVVTLLTAACVGLCSMATRHERAALETGVRKQGAALATNLAGDARILWLEEDSLGTGPLIEAHIQQVAQEDGLVGARLVKFEASESGEITQTIVASLNRQEQGKVEVFTLASPQNAGRTVTERRGSHLVVAAPVLYSGVPLGEAQIELDLDVLVEPVVKENQRQLAILACAVVLLGSTILPPLVKKLIAVPAGTALPNRSLTNAVIRSSSPKVTRPDTLRYWADRLKR